jgi:hypothetical protein
VPMLPQNLSWFSGHLNEDALPQSDSIHQTLES